jgi:hypothetical protein
MMRPSVTTHDYGGMMRTALILCRTFRPKRTSAARPDDFAITGALGIAARMR